MIKTICGTSSPSHFETLIISFYSLKELFLSFIVFLIEWLLGFSDTHNTHKLAFKPSHVYTQICIQSSFRHTKIHTETHRGSAMHFAYIHLHTHTCIQRCVLAASGFETNVALLSFIPSEVFFILFFFSPPVENRIHDPSPFLLTAQAIRCLGKRFPSYFRCLTKHLMTQVA